MLGNGHLEGLTLNKTPRGDEARDTSYLFIFIGAEPKDRLAAVGVGA